MYSYLLVAASLLAILNFRGCKDLEDCRSIYTNWATVEFKGESVLAISRIELDSPIKQKLASNRSADEKIANLLENLKNQKLPIRLHPKHNRITLLFYPVSPKDVAAPQPDTLTIFYERVASLLSPNCGIQEEYIISKVETTFAGSKIIKPALRKYESDEAENKKPNIEIYY